MLVEQVKDLKSDNGGNVAMMFSFCVVTFLSLAGLAVDGSRMHQVHQQLSMIADNAALAGAVAAENGKKNRLKLAKSVIEENFDGTLDADIDENYIIDFNDDSQELTVSLRADVDLFFGGIFGKEYSSIRSSSTTSYATQKIDPVTIAFALDVSGSMDWASSDGQKKIDVLKDSVDLLFNAVEDGAKRPDLLKDAIRTGMSAYNTAITSDRPMGWGWDHLETSVDNLIAEGGTNSTPALQNSYQQILDDRAYRQSSDSDFNQALLKEYVLFMTDGDNNQPVWDTDSQQVCRAMRTDGIQIFSVAFTAPEKGELLLLDCASWDDGTLPDEEVDPSAVSGAAGDGSKCNNNGSKGKGKALGHCKGGADTPMKEAKSRYFFDADNADSFKAAFVNIGHEISKSEIRIKH